MNPSARGLRQRNLIVSHPCLCGVLCKVFDRGGGTERRESDAPPVMALPCPDGHAQGTVVARRKGKGLIISAGEALLRKTDRNGCSAMIPGECLTRCCPDFRESRAKTRPGLGDVRTAFGQPRDHRKDSVPDVQLPGLVGGIVGVCHHMQTNHAGSQRTLLQVKLPSKRRSTEQENRKRERSRPAENRSCIVILFHSGKPVAFIRFHPDYRRKTGRLYRRR